MKRSNFIIFGILLTLCLLNVACNKYFVFTEYETKLEWVFSVRKNYDMTTPNFYKDTIWPFDGQNGVLSAELHISELSSDQEEFFVHFYLNDHLAAIQRFDKYREEGVSMLGSYTRYYDLYSDDESFHYEMIYDDEYYTLYTTSVFPILTASNDPYSDTITVNYFRIKD